LGRDRVREENGEVRIRRRRRFSKKRLHLMPDHKGESNTEPVVTVKEKDEVDEQHQD
jgi:hypothetical protein